MSRVLAWAAVVLLAATTVFAQANLPNENHYKVYRALPWAYERSVLLTDQFGTIQWATFQLDRFANPAEKEHDGVIYPMVDPLIHQTWWSFRYPQPTRTVVGIDQFGISQWILRDAVYLLNPALKFYPPGPPPPPPPPPVWNHYLCYEALGPTMPKLVLLRDQFGNCEVTVLQGKLFCNPVEKVDLADGSVSPIIDFAAHLTCYEVENPLQFNPTIVAIDQFGSWNLLLYNNDCLCVPALKEHIVKTEESTWGRIKALYQ
jgi:hypothetical protein